MARLSRNMTLDTDLYELTMVAGYRCLAMSGRRACFELFFRTIPDQGGYCVFAGLAPLIDYINNLRFTAEDMEFLSSLGSFSSKALQALEEGIHFSGDIWSLPEGTLVFSIEPLVRVIAPLEEAQFIETALLAIVSYQTLVATKAARLCHAAHGRPVIEFGTRRAQGIEAALGGSRAAYIGGCAATSNVQAGKSYGIPLRGTQAHSWIQSFPSETEAFSKFCEIFADNSVLLVDTYHIRDGLHHAIEVGVRLLRDGKKPPTGIRLDSGDLAYWSKKARLMMDEAGLHQTQILASGDLDEWLIESLVHQKAPIDAFCVGTKLMTSYNTPALGGVYKLAALANNGGVFEPKIKISDNPAKVTLPGIKNILRFYNAEGQMVGDLLRDYTESYSAQEPIEAIHPWFPHMRKVYRPPHYCRDILQPIFARGKQVYQTPSLHESRDHAVQELSRLQEEYKRLQNPHVYTVSLSTVLAQTRAELLRKYMQSDEYLETGEIA